MDNVRKEDVETSIGRFPETAVFITFDLVLVDSVQDSPPMVLVQ